MSNNSLLKLDGRTARGRSWKELSANGKPINQGALISNKICSHCNETPDPQSHTIKCMKCDLSFHITCLLKPVTEEEVKRISENPSMWWFCLNCISAKSSDITAAQPFHSTPSDVQLQTNLASFKKDVLEL